MYDQSVNQPHISKHFVMGVAHKSKMNYTGRCPVEEIIIVHLAYQGHTLDIHFQITFVAFPLLSSKIFIASYYISHFSVRLGVRICGLCFD